MQAKTSVLKSKSSNSAIKAPTASSRVKSPSRGQYGHGHKSRSSSEFLANRGDKKKKSMYVEKRSTKMSVQYQKADKPGCPPRRGKKTFMTSVLSILDQGTRSTQTELKKRVKDRRTVKSALIDLTTEALDTDDEKSQYSLQLREEHERSTHALEKKKRKEKKQPIFLKKEFCSKDFIMAPNKQMYANSDETVSCQKESSYDEVSEISDYTTPKKGRIYDEVVQGMLSHLDDEGVLKQVIEDMQINNVFRLNSEPVTLASESKKKENFDYLKQNISEKLAANYNGETDIENIFVDVIDNTLTCYNSDGQSSSCISKTTVKRDEEDTPKTKLNHNVDKKLRILIPEDKVSNGSIEDKDNDEGYNVTDDEINWNYDDTFQSKIFPDVRSRPKNNVRCTAPKRKRIKSASFNIPMCHKEKLDAFVPEKSRKKKTKKHMFLNMLKEELTKKTPAVEEPQNMFEALAIIARNKKKQQKEILFAETTTETNEHCRFGRKAFAKPKKTKKELRSKPKRRQYHLPISPSDIKSTPGYGSKVTNKMQSESDISLQVNDYIMDQRLPQKNILYAQNTNERFGTDVNEIFDEKLMYVDLEREVNDNEGQFNGNIGYLDERNRNKKHSEFSFATTKIQNKNTKVKSVSDSDDEDILHQEDMYEF